MQLCAGRSADQWRGFAALDPRGSEQPFAWHDSTGGHAACRHQHRSDHGRDADAEYIGLRREHDDESGNARHDGTGQRHGGRGNAGRIACIPIGLLRGTPLFRRLRAKRPVRPQAMQMPQAAGSSGTPILKPYLMVRPAFRAYVFLERPHRACPPEPVFRWPQSGRRTPVLCPRMRRAALSGSLSNGETDSRTTFLAFAGR